MCMKLLWLEKVNRGQEHRMLRQADCYKDDRGSKLAEEKPTGGPCNHVSTQAMRMVYIKRAEEKKEKDDRFKMIL